MTIAILTGTGRILCSPCWTWRTANARRLKHILDVQIPDSQAFEVTDQLFRCADCGEHID